MKFRSTAILVLFYLFNQGRADEVILDINDGRIRGFNDWVLPSGAPFYTFLGIPYAAPPLGDLRFQAPQPVQRWRGILNATSFDVQCYQTTGDSPNESEDCLKINVFTPQLPGDDVEPLPVVVYIYGGCFTVGDANPASYGPQYLIEHGVILVTFNHRLGPFGFLSTGDEVIPGNAGLKDQRQALQWTHDNIEFFGGDPSKVTLMGQSAGSASASYQLLNKANEGLIRGAILESGTAINQWARHSAAREFAFKTAEFIDQSFQNSDDVQGLREFLLNVPASAIDAASQQVANWAGSGDREWYQGMCIYTPVIEVEHEGAFITEKMYELVKSGSALRVPVLMGINSEEQLYDSIYLDSLQNWLEKRDSNLSWIVPDDMRILDLDQRKQMGQAVREIYVGDGLLADNLADGVRYDSDTTFTRAIIRYAQLQSQFTDVFFYQFSYDGEVGGVDFGIEGAGKVAHGEELAYLFYNDGNSNPDQVSAPDRLTMNRLHRLWTDFIINLNPTPDRIELLENIIWPTVSSTGQPDDFMYLDIDRNLTVRNHPKESSFGKWKALYDSLGYDDLESY